MLISTDFRSPQVQVLVLSANEEVLVVLLLLVLELVMLGVAKNVGFSCPAMMTKIFSSYGFCGFWSWSDFPSPASRSRSDSLLFSR